MRNFDALIFFVFNNIFRSEKMPADVACFISHSPEWKALTASMFDLSPSLLDNKPQRHRHLPRTKSFAPSPSAKATQLYNTVSFPDLLSHPSSSFSDPDGAKHPTIKAKTN